MSEKSVAEKLLLKPNQKVRVIDPPDAYEKLVGGLPEGARPVTAASDSPADLVHLFATSKERLDELLPAAIEEVRPDGLLWIAYPRVSAGGYDISREAVHDALRANGWKPVTQISMDEVWTAIRARPVAPS